MGAIVAEGADGRSCDWFCGCANADVPINTASPNVSKLVFMGSSIIAATLPSWAAALGSRGLPYLEQEIL